MSNKIQIIEKLKQFQNYRKILIDEADCCRLEIQLYPSNFSLVIDIGLDSQLIKIDFPSFDLIKLHYGTFWIVKIKEVSSQRFEFEFRDYNGDCLIILAESMQVEYIDDYRVF